MTTLSDLDAVTTAYVECALWASNADHLDPEGTGAAGSMDDHYGVEDFAPEALQSIADDCAAFVVANADDCSDLDAAQIGHDFWLTRNRHGAGFWDRGYGKLGDRLTAAAHAYGTSDLYIGDDGKVYVS